MNALLLFDFQLDSMTEIVQLVSIFPSTYLEWFIS